MHRTDKRLKSAASTLLVAMTLLISGCATSPTTVEPVVTQTPPPTPVRKHLPVEPPQSTATRVAVVLSDGKPAYQDVANELAELLEDASVYNLADAGLSPHLVMDVIAETQPDVLVAIGLRAAVAATARSKVPVVFCQVFNFAGHQLISDRSKGVASIPPLNLQVAAWKQIDPNLQNVGAILGEGHEYLVAQATQAAEQHGVKLHHRTAKSDRETLYLFNQLLPHIDGFWLFPDNRVLSPPVLREMLDNASRHDIQVAVFNDSFLDLGATISATTRASDIAARIVSIVDQFEQHSGESIPDITPLTEVTIGTNEAVLRELGLSTASVQPLSDKESVR